MADLNRSNVKASLVLGRQRLPAAPRPAGAERRQGPHRPRVPPARASRLALEGTGARVLGGDLTVSGGSLPGDASQLRFERPGHARRRGAETPPKPARCGGWPASSAARRLTGFSVSTGRGAPELLLTSPLTGLALELPAPLRKAADTALPLTLTAAARARRGRAAAARHAEGRVRQRRAGALPARADAGRRRARAARRHRRGRSGAAARRPACRRTRASRGSTSTRGRPRSTSSAPPGAGAPVDAGYLPQSVTLKAQELLLNARRFTHVTANAEPRRPQLARQHRGRPGRRLPSSGAAARSEQRACAPGAAGAAAERGRPGGEKAPAADPKAPATSAAGARHRRRRLRAARQEARPRRTRSGDRSGAAQATGS